METLKNIFHQSIFWLLAASLLAAVLFATKLSDPRATLSVLAATDDRFCEDLPKDSLAGAKAGIAEQEHIDLFAGCAGFLE